jgi:hypothetical protein
MSRTGRFSPATRAQAQRRVRRLTRALVVLTGVATACLGVLVAREHPGASVPISTPGAGAGGTTTTTTPPPRPTTAPPTAGSTGSGTGDTTSSSTPPTTTPTTLPPTTTTTRPSVTSGGTSRR